MAVTAVATVVGGGDGGGSDRSSSCGSGSGNPPNDLCRPISPSPYLLAVAALRPARGVGRNDDEAEEKKLHLLLVLYLCSVRVFAQRGGRRGMVSGPVIFIGLHPRVLSDWSGRERRKGRSRVERLPAGPRANGSASADVETTEGQGL